MRATVPTPTRLRVLRALVTGIAALPVIALAQALCSADQQPLCLNRCTCLPAPVPPASLQSEALYQRLQGLAATGLEAWIRQSRDQLALQPSQPVPLQVRSQLEPYYDLAVLETARYRVGDDNVLTTAGALLRNPDIAAVTLIDLIVFRNEADAEHNVALWAHELKHVEQYLQWGVGEFARRYTQDYQQVERPGYAMELWIERDLGQRAAGPAAP